MESSSLRAEICGYGSQSSPTDGSHTFLLEIATHERFAAGEPDLPHPEPMDRDTDQPGDLPYMHRRHFLTRSFPWPLPVFADIHLTFGPVVRGEFCCLSELIAFRIHHASVG